MSQSLNDKQMLLRLIGKQAKVLMGLTRAGDSAEICAGLSYIRQLAEFGLLNLDLKENKARMPVKRTEMALK